MDLNSLLIKPATWYIGDHLPIYTTRVYTRYTSDCSNTYKVVIEQDNVILVGDPRAIEKFLRNILDVVDAVDTAAATVSPAASAATAAVAVSPASPAATSDAVTAAAVSPASPAAYAAAAAATSDAVTAAAAAAAAATRHTRAYALLQHTPVTHRGEVNITARSCLAGNMQGVLEKYGTNVSVGSGQKESVLYARVTLNQGVLPWTMFLDLVASMPDIAPVL